MKFALIAIALLGLFFAFFWFLQWLSDRTYKPSRDQIKRIFEATIEGKLSLGAFDEFSCVRIAYDPRLDRLREKYKRIVDDPAHMAGEITWQNITPLNEAGKEKLRELISELEQLPL